MATIEKQTVTIPATQLRKLATTLRRIRNRGVESWGNHYLLSEGCLYGGDPLDTLAAASIGEPSGEPIAIPHDTLAAALKGAKGEVILTVGEVRTTVGTFAWQHDSDMAQGMANNAEAITCEHDVEPAHVATMTGAEYRDAVSIAGLHVSRDESRPVLTGVCITRSGQWGATDSYRLLVMQPPTMGEPDSALDPIIPFRALDTAARLSGAYTVQLSEYVRDGNAYAHISTGNACRVWSRLIDGQYPNFTALLPEGAEYVLSMGDDGADALIRFCKAAGRTNLPVKLTFGNTSRVLGVECGDSMTTLALDSPMMGEAQTVGLNAAFLADSLSAMPQGGVELHVISPLRPVTFRAADSSQDTYNVTAVCMPMRTV